MRRFILFLSALAATPAYAAECENDLYGGGASGYLDYRSREVLSTQPVIQAGAMRTCGSWSLEGFLSTEVGDGEFGERFGDEVSLGVTNTGTLGNGFDYEASAYLSSSAPLAGDPYDVLELSGEVSRPTPVGPLEIAPYLRVTQWFGLGEQDQTFLSPGARASLPLSDAWSLSAEGEMVFDLTNGTQTPYVGSTLEGALGESVSVELYAQYQFREDQFVAGFFLTLSF